MSSVKGPPYFIFIPREEMVYLAMLLNSRFPSPRHKNTATLKAFKSWFSKVPAVNFIYKPPWPVLSFRQELHHPSIQLRDTTVRDADTTYKASSKAKGKHGSQQHLMQSLSEETHASATLRHDTLQGVKVNKNVLLHPVTCVYYFRELHSRNYPVFPSAAVRSRR